MSPAGYKSTAVFEGRIYLAVPAKRAAYATWAWSRKTRIPTMRCAANGAGGISPWQSRIGASGEPPKPGDERRRIAEARQWGWSAIPGSDFTATADGAGWRLEGHSVGHGVGMCQFGAAGMAAAGAGFRDILSYYNPNTELITLP